MFDLRVKANGWLTSAYAASMLGIMGAAFGSLGRIRRQLIGMDGQPYKAKLVFRTFDGRSAVSAIFENGFMTSRAWAVANPDVTVFFRDGSIMRDLLSAKPKGDIFNALLNGDVYYDGNLSHLSRFSFLSTEIVKPKLKKNTGRFESPENAVSKRSPFKPAPMKQHEGIEFLENPALSNLTIDDLPDVREKWIAHFTTRPSVCSERAKLETDFYRANGFEKDSSGKKWDPVLRQGRMIKFLLENRKIVFEDNDSLPGTTTTKPVGIPIYPEFGGLAIWPELNTVAGRELNPYDIDPEDLRILNDDVFPFWIDRNIREYVRKKHSNPTCQKLEERWVLYFMWKVHALSHTIPDLPAVLSKGLEAIRDESLEAGKNASDAKAANFHKAAAEAIQGVLAYANNLAEAIEQRAMNLDKSKDAELIAGLKDRAQRIRNAPAKPARNFAEAINAIWIVWTALHMENMNAGLSLGRLDQWLQPYLAMDIGKTKTKVEREKVIENAVRLCAHFFLKCQDHLPLVPDIGNRLFGGSSSDQAITVGGVDKDGNSAVNDMTYIILKAAELLGLRDPNLNARYFPGVNPPQYLRRLVEVNAITCATPSIHNDKAIIDSMVNQGFVVEDARDWGATGCVEPTSCGRHMGHTNCMLLNLVAPLEMALKDGFHPFIGEQVGLPTGDLRNENGPVNFEKFFHSYKAQLKAMIDNSIDYNNLLGFAHQRLHPTPLLSSMINGTAESAKDVTLGGARYNSSGAALVALVDVVDSLAAIKKLVYDDGVVSWREYMQALDADFQGYDRLHAIIKTKAPKFGDGDPEPVAIANELIDFVYDAYNSRENYRGGKYTCGFWSMSNHVAFGTLSGALPSGRKRGKAFTPGITPSVDASKTILEPIHAVGNLDPLKMTNNIAFNVKLFPAPGQPPEKFVENAAGLVEAYMKMGGMQMQFNIVTGEMLQDAMEHPENYRNLLVRISGYNAYFVELNHDMQIELIERSGFTA